jgi:enoyl-CoA hydratase/carnithine racemase
VELTREGDVFLLCMRDGENRIDAAFLSELEAVLDRVEGASGPAALVTSGEGRFYCTGLDLQALAGAGRDGAIEVLAGLHRLFARLLAFPVPTVAALNGHAFAAGAMLALAHDFRVMREDRGFFCLPEIDLATGQPLTDGMTALIDAKLPRPAFHEALVTGRRYGGPEAVQRQLVHEAHPESRLLPRARELAAGLAGKDRATLVALRRGLFADALEVLEGAGARQPPRG